MRAPRALPGGRLDTQNGTLISGRILNWSERKRWQYSLPVALFRLFGRTRNFNPLAIVFQPLTWPRRFPFYRAFQAFKHGRPEEVERMRRELFERLDELAPLKNAKSRSEGILQLKMPDEVPAVSEATRRSGSNWRRSGPPSPTC